VTGQAVTFSGAALAAWMTAEYDERNALDLVAQINLTAQLALADNDNGAAVVLADTATDFAIPEGTVL
jgi:hypothetical protein